MRQTIKTQKQTESRNKNRKKRPIMKNNLLSTKMIQKNMANYQ